MIDTETHAFRLDRTKTLPSPELLKRMKVRSRTTTSLKVVEPFFLTQRLKLGPGDAHLLHLLSAGVCTRLEWRRFQQKHGYLKPKLS